MSLPINIKKEHLLSAIEKINVEGVPANADSQYYDVVYQGKRYPPKLVVSYANIFANREELDRRSFPGGKGTPCFNLIESNGLTIAPKIGIREEEVKMEVDYYEELERFLQRARMGGLGTADFRSELFGLTVSVSFGRGNAAKVPWIAFLGANDKVQKGIYPVYLFYKNLELLVLAYGLSETNIPEGNWGATGAQSISAYFAEHGLGEPARYGSSLVYAIYDTSIPISEEKINADLGNLLTYYKGLDRVSTIDMNEKVDTNFLYDSFHQSASEANLLISKTLTLRFVSALLVKPFVILTGLAGSGKTKIANLFSEWICGNRNQYCIVPVGADWTNREPLLGYSNALEPGSYILPENGALQLIIEAAKSENQDKPYFLILDEMNLSHVERYFADFLSVMESGSEIALHPNTTTWASSPVPATIKLPKNLFVIGTVNIDETTYMFSPKVLDRASVIEFRINDTELAEYLSKGAILNADLMTAKGSAMGRAFVSLANNRAIAFGNMYKIKGILLDFFSELKKVGAEFGYRTASEIVRLGAVINTIEPTWDVDEILDVAIMQKLLPKLHGSRRKMEPVLRTLGTLCLSGGQDIYAILESNESVEHFDKGNVRFPIALEKIKRMYQGAIDNGFTSYAEA